MSSDIIAQFGVLFVIIVGETLRHPVRHALFLHGGDGDGRCRPESRLGAAIQIFAAGNRNRCIFWRNARLWLAAVRAAGQSAGEQGRFATDWSQAIPR